MVPWRGLCLLLVGCTNAASPDAADDENDAKRRDARVATPQDARTDAGLDAASTLDAAPTNDAAPEATAGSWMEVPAGSAVEPREVCARTWEVPGGSVIDGFGSLPIVRFGRVASDAEGRILAAGSMVAPFDFGTGTLSVPEQQSTTFLLALDSACEVLWVRTFVAGSGSRQRTPVALDFDAAQHPVLITTSIDSREARSYELLTLDVDGEVLSEKVLPVRNAVASAWTARQGHVLLTGSYFMPPDLGWGPLGDPAVGLQFNVLLRADGTVTRQDVFGTPNLLTLVEQRIGPSGELLALGRAVENYFGATFVGPTLAKVDGSGKLAWTRELSPQNPNGTDTAQLDVGEDGSIAFWLNHYDGTSFVSETSLSELAPDGASRWSVPITSAPSDSLRMNGLRMGKRSIAAHATIRGGVRVGNVVLRGYSFESELIMQVDQGGAVRWALTFDDAEQPDAFAITGREDVVVASVKLADYGSPSPTFLRVYHQE